MMLKTINLKEYNPSVDQALAIIEIEIENAKKEEIKILKVIHGYGSRGHGGIILVELRKWLKQRKAKGDVLDFFDGASWNLMNEQARKVILENKVMDIDCDLNTNNPGITLIILK